MVAESTTRYWIICSHALSLVSRTILPEPSHNDGLCQGIDAALIKVAYRCGGHVSKADPDGASFGSVRENFILRIVGMAPI
jgi:hypothetical protein